jgi:hypothetical protein
MPEDPLPPRPVTVILDDDLKITAVPYKVKIYRNNQLIRWQLVSHVPGWTWASGGEGVVIHTSGSVPPYVDWPGAPAEPCGPDGKFWCANGGHPNMTDTPILYQYDINLELPDDAAGADGATRGGPRRLTLRASAGGGGSDAAAGDDRSEAMIGYDPDISNEPQP